MLAAMFGVAMTNGMTGKGPPSVAGVPHDNRTLKVANMMKHWTAYGVEQNRFGFNSNISLHDLVESYFRPTVITAQAAALPSLMCAYDAINGTPSCLNGWMTDTVLRQHYNQPNIVSFTDCGATSPPPNPNPDPNPNPNPNPDRSTPYRGVEKRQ